ncbi:MAG TPA: response regulator transcription factor [Solirubrobacteraceae bacterium]|nr:response regulator transcription factor [Solirubrobacteraceae bacterium]
MKRLVIVADNSLIVQAIRIGFRQGGEFNLVGRADGRRVSAEAIVDARPDVILFDDMDRSERSLALIREITAKDDAVAVIVLSVHLDPAWMQRLFDAGAISVISKATQPIALATLVRETINGHIYHRLATVTEAAEPAPEIAPGEELPLTARELEILKLVAAGFTNGDIARRLWVTEQTVKFHLRNVYRKLHVTNRTQATRIAFVRGVTSIASDAALAAAPAPAS